MDPDQVKPTQSNLPESTSGSRDRERLEAIERELGEIFFRRAKKRMADVGTGAVPDHTTLHLTLRLAAPDTPQDPGSGQLAEQLQRAADRCADRYAAFPVGHVYCHWCRSFTCAHSAPPEPRCVFGGYSATGQPYWREFASVVLERRDPRIEYIFREPPLPLSLVQGERELAEEQLSVYGKSSPIYRILGQVVSGYISLNRPAGEDRSPLAVTIQAIETRRGASGGGAPTVTINILGKLDDGTPAYQALEESCDARVADALLGARRKLSMISVTGGSRRRRRWQRRKRVLDVLRQLARNLDRIFRQRKRRTRHSQRRHSNPGRPTSTALSDALRAERTEIYRDVEEQTWVVVGPKNRVHVFNDKAQHITSVVYPGETVRYRTTRGKWRNPSPDETNAFLKALRAQEES